MAPIILHDQQSQWFKDDEPSPYMLFASEATSLCRDSAPAIVHADGTGRLQTADDHHVLTEVLRLFHDTTGVPMLINTSLNGPGEPMSQTHADTLRFCQGRDDIVAYLEGERADR